MNIENTNLLLQYILALAGQAEEWEQRQLLPIHLLKYTYLADLAWAKQHDGETYSGTPWIFWSFGPYSNELFTQIDPALSAIHATANEFSSKYKEKSVSWFIRDEQLLEELEKKLPFTITSTVNQAFKKHGTATYDLLHEVYHTHPILNAAPGEKLVFTPKQTPSKDLPASPALTGRQKKKRKQAFREAKKKFREKMNRKLEKLAVTEPSPPPRYDEVFEEAIDCLVVREKEEIEEGKYVLIIDQSVWKSGSRMDPDVS
ncbi:MAG: hypothetical protein ACLFV2_09210 [Desulfurivibrionaceae bacterium]